MKVVPLCKILLPYEVLQHNEITLHCKNGATLRNVTSYKTLQHDEMSLCYKIVLPYEMLLLTVKVPHFVPRSLTLD